MKNKDELTVGNEPINMSQQLYKAAVEQCETGAMNSTGGITKREEFASRILPALVARNSDELSSAYSNEELAEWAVNQADALIKALNKDE